MITNLRRLFPTSKLSYWLKDRLFLDSVSNYLRAKTVPNHKHTFWYLFGGLTLFFFLVQLLTGALLLFYYKPTPEAAHQSVRYIIEEVPFGRFVRSAHVWSSHGMVAAVTVHMFSAYFMKAYRRPREIMWLVGFLLLILTLGFAFTGYLLPWDTTAFFATQIGTEIPRSIPVLGESIVYLLRGSSEVDANTLSRLFALHVLVLPVMALTLIGIHLLLNQLYGTSKPIGLRETGQPIHFYPNFLVRDWITWLISALVLVAAAASVQWSLGPKADPFAPAPAGIRPEWYFWFLYETYKLMPAKIGVVSGELLVNFVLIAAAVLWWMIPLLDRKAKFEVPSREFTRVGIMVAVYLVVMTLLAAWFDG